MKILIVEDHPKIRENIFTYLKALKYLPETAINWQDALEKTFSNKYDCIILDVNMPVLNWREFLKKFRKSWFKTPVIALTSNTMLSDKVEMFELWVDDYLVKPFELKELQMRINALNKRQSNIIENILEIDDIKINFSKHQILKWKNIIDFSNKEYLIIEFLVQNKGYPKTKNQILEKVWWEQEENLNMSSTTLEAHISTIRKKLWSNFIKTIKWTWYIIE